MDAAHGKTDEILEKMEKRLTGIYDRAQKEIQKTSDEYFAKFRAMDAIKAKAVADGELDPDEYKTWRQNKLLYGKRYADFKQQIAEELLQVNQTATAYINGQLPGVYALNYNALQPAVEGVGGYSFTLTDADTVKHLAAEDNTLLPYKEVDGRRDVRWNTQKVNSEVLQGILQGDSIPKIAKRMRNVTEMNRVSSIRNARTTVTSAECKGRQDSYVRAEQDGIKMVREWMATEDGRTRHTHRLLDGQQAAVDKPFTSELGFIMYPGDPEAQPANVYNCRCTIVARVKGFKKPDAAAPDAPAAAKKETKTKAADKAEAKAKTTEEAESFAQRFVDKYKSKYTGNVDYKGIEVHYANEMNRALDEVLSQYEIKYPIRNIVPFNTRKAQFKDTTAEAAYQWGLSDLFYNKKYYKSKKVFEAHLKETEDLTKQILGGIDDLIEKYKSDTSYSGKIEYRYLMGFKKTGRSNVFAPDAYGSTIHELGHCLDDKLFRAEIKKRKINLEESFDQYATGISAYATSSTNEYMAESFAAFWKGEESIIDPKLLSLFKELRK